MTGLRGDLLRPGLHNGSMSLWKSSSGDLGLQSDCMSIVETWRPGDPKRPHTMNRPTACGSAESRCCWRLLESPSLYLSWSPTEVEHEIVAVLGVAAEGRVVVVPSHGLGRVVVRELALLSLWPLTAKEFVFSLGVWVSCGRMLCSHHMASSIPTDPSTPGSFRSVSSLFCSHHVISSILTDPSTPSLC